MHALLHGDWARIRRTLCLVTLTLVAATPLSGADPAFFGAIAILDDVEVGTQLGLTDAQKQSFEQLILQRESAAVQLAIEAKQLDRKERDQRQALFVAESERQGMAILTESQRADFKKLRLAREGLGALGRSELADAVGLTEDQRKQVQDILLERQAAIQKTEDERKRRFARVIFDRRIDRLLTDEQRLAWQSLAQVSSDSSSSGGDQATDGAAAADSGTATSDTADSDSTAGGGPAANVSGDGLLQFNFEYAPWKAVLEWFAEQAQLSLVLESPPPGTFNLVEQRRYTPEAALDVINSVLLTKGYTLVRRESMLIVINLEDGIPPNLLTTVPMQELDQRGEFELVSTLFRLGKIDPEDAEQEITKLLGPQGSIQVLGKAKQAFVTETAGRLRTIRDVLRAMEDPNAVNGTHVTTYELKHIVPEEAFAVLRQMLGLPEGMNAAADGTMRMATDVLGQRIMVTGQPQQVEQVGEILKLVDVPMPASATSGGILASPQLEVYAISSADPDSVLEVLQTLLVDADVRLAIDPKTSNLVALAVPSDHALIRATLQQMQLGGQTIDVIRLNYVDPQIAVMAINQLFGGGAEGDPDAPKVNADVTTGQLLVRGSKAQIEQIHSLLDKMGEADDDFADDGVGRNVRVLPISGSDADAVLEQLQQIWPSVRPNRIRTVVPSAVIRSVRPRSPESRDADGPSSKPASESTKRRDQDASDSNRSDMPRPTAPARSGIGFRASPERWIAQVQLPSDLLGESTSTDPATKKETDAVDDHAGADIVVAVGASGLIIASQDLDALDEVEELLLSLNSGQAGQTRDFAVFYLRHSTADAATQILNRILGGEAAPADGAGGGGGLLDGIAGAALGGVPGGDLMGSLLGLGGDSGSLQASGSFSIVPDSRLNLLVVQANAADMKLIEQLLEIIDQRASPETVQTIPPPRLIPVYHVNAETVAEVVRQVFANQLASGPGQQNQPSPQDFIRALRRGGQGGGGQENEQDERKLTVGVDARGNQLVVAAPEDLFRQVSELVHQLDQADPDSAEMTRVITLNGTNPELVRRALNTIVGAPATAPNAATGQAAAPSSPTDRSTTGRGRRSSGGATDMRQQFEMFRALQGGGGDRGRGGAGRGGRTRGGGRPTGATDGGGGRRGGPGGGGSAIGRGRRGN